MRRILWPMTLATIAALLIAPVASAVTVTDWTSSPVTVGDKTFTLISTNLAGNDNVGFADLGGGLYVWTLSPVSDNLLTSTSRTLIFKVTIVDNPATPGDESILMFFAMVSGDGDRYIASGTFTTTGIFDDSSDFSSPLTTFSNSGTPWGPNNTPGNHGEMFVKLTFTAAGGSTILSGYAITFTQAEVPVPTPVETWGRIKALYR